MVAGVPAAFATGFARLVALAALAVAFASTLLPQRQRVLGALVGALAGNALLHLGDLGLGRHGAPTLVAVAAALPVLLSGYRYATRAGRRQTRLAVAVGGGALAVIVLLAAGTVLAARSHLERGISEANDALAASRSGELDTARAQFDRAERSLDQGAGLLGAPWMAPARAVPVLSQNLAATAELSRTGRDALGSANDAAAVTADGALSLQGGRVDLAAVADAEEPLARAVAGIDDALAEIDAHDSPWLAAPLADRIGELRVDLADAQGSAETALLAVRHAPGMLGVDGTRHYLVLLTNTAETRNLGGFVGNWAQITADDGRLQLTGSGRANALSSMPGAQERTLSGPDDYLARYARYTPSVHLVNVTASPDFPTVARVAAEVFPQAGIGPVDGVVALDPAGLAAVMSLTGPVSVPGVAEPLDADGLERFLLVDQYALFPEIEAREAMLDQLIDATFLRFLTDADPDPGTVADTFDRVVREDRVLVWTPDEDEQALLARAGVDGRFPRPAPGLDLLSVRTANASANKMDAYLSRTIDHTAAIDRDSGALTATTHITLTSDAPPELPAYVAGRGDDEVSPGENRQLVSIYTPHLVEEVRVGGSPVPIESQTELGWNVYSLFVVVPPSGTVEIEAELIGQVDLGEYRFVWDAQPLHRPDEVRLQVQAGDRTLVNVDETTATDIEVSSSGADDPDGP